MPHTRTDIELDDEVLRALRGAPYKVLRYLVNRADARGVCYPGNEKVAMGVNYDLRSIERLIPELVEAGLVAYLRRNEIDRFTGRRQFNVYQINPAYICIAEAHQAEANALWEEATGGTTRLLSRTLTNNKNQHHDPAPDKPAPRTNNNNQPARAASNAKKPKEPPADPTAAREDDATQDAPQDNSAQRTAKPTDSGVPPRAPSKRFANPMPLAETLPDQQHENLALRLRGLGLPMAMARGFVVEYGVKPCEDALLQTLAADKANDEGIRNHGGFFRSVLQQGLADRATFKAHEEDGEAHY